MEIGRRLYLEELKLAWVRDAGNPDALNQYYSKRQERLETMANRVVTIQACGSLGSGVMLDSQGHIVTNAHVVESGGGACSTIIVTTVVGWQGAAKLVLGSYDQDVAILRVEPNPGFSGTEIAPEVFLGQDVYAVGHPLGQRHTVTRGIISYPRRIIELHPYVQTDASINPGNSGGGLFDELGRLVGLPTFKEVWADKSKTIPVTNIGFAVPGDIVQEYYFRALQRGEAVGCTGDPGALRRAVILG